MSAESSILVIQLARLGDVVQTTPLLRELAETAPGKVDLLVLEETREALEGLPGLGAVRTLPGKWMALNQAITEGFRDHRIPPEATVLFRSLGLPAYRRVINASYHALDCWLAGRVSCWSREGGAITEQGEWLYFGEAQSYLPALVSCREQNWFNLVDIFRCAGPRTRIPQAASRPYVHTSSELPWVLPPGRKVALNPGASRSNRCWPAANFARLAEGLEKAGFASIFVGAPADLGVCEQVQAHSRISLPNFCGKTSVAQMARILAEADLLVSGDTGAVHIAAAVGTPVLGLYGASACFRETAPWGHGHLILQAPLNGEVALIDPDTAFAATRYRLGILPEIELKRALDGSGVEGWETDFLPAGSDPLGGLTYHPVHTCNLGMEELFSRALRHALARDFCASQDAISLTYLCRRRDRAPESVLRAEVDQLRAEITFLTGALDGMSRAAAECRRLAARPTRESSVRSSKRVTQMIEALEELKRFTQEKPLLKPMIQFLDWRLRMSPPLAPQATFEFHECEYRRARRILDEAVSLSRAFPSRGDQCVAVAGHPNIREG